MMVWEPTILNINSIFSRHKLCICTDKRSSLFESMVKIFSTLLIHHEKYIVWTNLRKIPLTALGERCLSFSALSFSLVLIEHVR